MKRFLKKLKPYIEYGMLGIGIVMVITVLANIIYSSLFVISFIVKSFGYDYTILGDFSIFVLAIGFIGGMLVKFINRK